MASSIPRGAPFPLTKTRKPVQGASGGFGTETVNRRLCSVRNLPKAGVLVCPSLVRLWIGGDLASHTPAKKLRGFSPALLPMR